MLGMCIYCAKMRLFDKLSLHTFASYYITQVVAILFRLICREVLFIFFTLFLTVKLTNSVKFLIK